MDHFNGPLLKKNRKGDRRAKNRMGKKSLLDLDFADDSASLMKV